MSRHRRLVAGTAVVVASALGVAACGTGRATPPARSAAPMTARVTVHDYAFAPARTQVQVGGTVTFTNRDATAHTATAADQHSFDSGSIAAHGGARTVRFSRAGTFAYYCVFHPYMKGTVVVVAR